MEKKEKMGRRVHTFSGSITVKKAASFPPLVKIKVVVLVIQSKENNLSHANLSSAKDSVQWQQVGEIVE